MAGDKTEKATPKKRRDERKKGNVMMSKDVVAVSTLLGSLVMLKLMGGVVVEQADSLFATCFYYINGNYAGMLPTILRELSAKCMTTVAVVAGPFLGVTAMLAITATFAQTRLLVTGESLKPKFSRVNPLQGFKRLFSLRSVVEAVKSLLKIIILLYLIYNYFTSVVTGFARFLDMELNQAAEIPFVSYLGVKSFDEIMELYPRVYCVVVPSYWIENYPNTALEAVANKTIVIGSGRGGIPEIIRDERLLFDILDLDSFRKCLDYVLQMGKEEYGIITEQMFEYLQMHNTQERYYERLLEIYRTIGSGPDRGSRNGGRIPAHGEAREGGIPAEKNMSGSTQKSEQER